MIIIITMRDLMKTKAYKSLRDLMIHWGFTETEASIYTLLALNQRAMDAREIAKEIHRAYSSVVNELNKLIRAGLVERTKGERCYNYTAVIDLIKLIRLERRKMLRMLTDLKGCLDDMDSGEYEEFRKHLEEALEYLGRLDKEA